MLISDASWLSAWKLNFIIRRAKMSLAESMVYAHQLNETVKGKKIINAVVNQNPHTFVWFALHPSDAYCEHTKSNEIARKYEPYLLNQTIKYADAKNGGYGTYTFIYIRRSMDIYET
jgi:hypothetical protein